VVYSKTPKSRGFPEHRSPRLSQSQKRFLTTFPNRNPTETKAIFYSKTPTAAPPSVRLSPRLYSASNWILLTSGKWISLSGIRARYSASTTWNPGRVPTLAKGLAATSPSGAIVPPPTSATAGVRRPTTKNIATTKRRSDGLRTTARALFRTYSGLRSSASSI